MVTIFVKAVETEKGHSLRGVVVDDSVCKLEENFMRLLYLGLILAGLPSSACSGPAQLLTTIKEIRTGWDAEMFAIVTNEPIANPANCPTADGYVTDSKQPGYNTYYVAAITAFVERAKIVVVVAEKGCIAGRPKLIGINVRR